MRQLRTNMESNLIDFSYAAGKAASGSISGTFQDSNGSDPMGGFAPPGVNMQWNTDGKVYISYLASGFNETYDWYVGGAPTGITNFQLVVTSRFGGSSILWTHNVGTFNFTSSFVVGITMTDTEAPRTGEMHCTVNVTRGVTTTTHSFILGVVAGAI